MIPASFEYLRPKTLPEAIGLLQQYGDDAKILSGGQSLIPMMKLRLARPGYLDRHQSHHRPVVYQRRGRLFEDRRADARSRTGSFAAGPRKIPDLIDTAHVIADPQVRNLATVGGNLAHGDPANDHPATMVALGAQIVATGAKGERVIPIDDFFLSLFSTALQPDEILTEIRIPITAAAQRRRLL